MKKLVIVAVAALLLVALTCCDMSRIYPEPGLTGTWSGTGAYFGLDTSGVRVFMVYALFSMTLVQVDAVVTGTMSVTVREVSDNNIPSPGLVVVQCEYPESFILEVSGTVSGDTLSFLGKQSGWSFRFTDTELFGTCENMDKTTYLGLESEREAIRLMRR